MTNTETSPREFSWLGYRALIQNFLLRDYEVRLFDELDSNENQLVLRHDIDFSMAAAVDMARIEADLGVRAHYYVLLRTEFYNLAGPEDWGRLIELSELGHNVGLHFDASRYDQDIDSLEHAAAQECVVLEKLLGKNINSISFHRPAQKLRGLERSLAGRSHAYQPRYFNDITYISDSRGYFRYGHPLDHEAFDNRQSMQLLTHPIWWPQKEVKDKMTILEDFLTKKATTLQHEAIANCISYAEYLKN